MLDPGCFVDTKADAGIDHFAQRLLGRGCWSAICRTGNAAAASLTKANWGKRGGKEPPALSSFAS